MSRTNFNRLPKIGDKFLLVATTPTEKYVFSITARIVRIFANSSDVRFSIDRITLYHDAQIDKDVEDLKPSVRTLQTSVGTLQTEVESLKSKEMSALYKHSFLNFQIISTRAEKYTYLSSEVFYTAIKIMYKSYLCVSVVPVGGSTYEVCYIDYLKKSIETEQITPGSFTDIVTPL